MDFYGFITFYQFLPYAYFVTSDGVEKKVYAGLKLYEEPIVGTEEHGAGS